LIHPFRLSALLPVLALAVLVAPVAPAAAQKVSGSVNLVQLGEKLGASVWYDPLTGTGGFEKNGVYGGFALDQACLLWNWKEAVAVPAPRDTGNGIFFDAAFVAEAARRYEAIRAAGADKYRVAAILIDPGHGGKDTGAVGEHGTLRLAEKDITLKAAHRVAELLTLRFPDRRIMLTREGDSYPTLEERVEMANRAKLEDNEAIIYVSIHANASFNKDAKGYEVWYLNPEYRRTVVDADTVKDKGHEIAPILNAMLEEEFTTESIILARKVMDRLGSAIGRESVSRGIRAEEWFVVRNAKMPSILIEMGFVTNPDEAALLADDAYLRRIADAIYNGIVDFVGHFEG